MSISQRRTLRGRGFTNTYPLRVWDYVNVRKGPVSLRVTSMPGTHGPMQNEYRRILKQVFDEKAGGARTAPAAEASGRMAA